MSSDDEVIQAIAAGSDAGLVMDFDGVLSPITDEPALSELLRGTAQTLERLAGRLSTVALLSGRPVGFLADRATIPGVDLYGSYGLERLTDGGIDVVPEAQEWTTAVQAATRELHRELDSIDGVDVEEKSLMTSSPRRRARSVHARPHGRAASHQGETHETLVRAMHRRRVRSRRPQREHCRLYLIVVA